MSQQPTNSSAVCHGLIDIRDHFKQATEDGFVSHQEQQEIEAEIEQTYVLAETQDVAILFAVQLLRIPSAAPNRHIWSGIEDVARLAHRWRGMMKGKPKLTLVAKNEGGEPKEIA